MHVEHAYPIVTRMAERHPEEAVVASRYNFRVVTTGQEFVSVSDYPTCMVRGPREFHMDDSVMFDSLRLMPVSRAQMKRWTEI